MNKLNGETVTLKKSSLGLIISFTGLLAGFLTGAIALGVDRGDALSRLKSVEKAQETMSLTILKLAEREVELEKVTAANTKALEILVSSQAANSNALDVLSTNQTLILERMRVK